MDWDVVVVGGGPAGAAAGIRLSRLGYAVLILDRAGFPRPKACGESVNPGAVDELRQLGVLEAVCRLPHTRVRRWSVQPRCGPSFAASLPRDAYGMGIDRSRFDELLLAEARMSGAAVVTGSRVTRLRFDGDRVTGVYARETGEHRARIVIGADGLRSVVVRQLRLVRRRPRLRKTALTAHVAHAEVAEGTGELHFLPWGCAGMVRIDAAITNVVFVLQAEAFAANVGSTGARFESLLRSVPALGSASRAGPVLASGPFDWPTTAVSAAGALLVGDAAGYFDPFTGQGIYRALHGARMAADCVARRLDEGQRSRVEFPDYEHAHHTAFDGPVHLQHLIESITSRRWTMAGVSWGLRVWPALTHRLVATTADLPQASR